MLLLSNQRLATPCFLALLLASAGLEGCSDLRSKFGRLSPGSVTRVSFRRDGGGGALWESSTLAGGMMIYAYGEQAGQLRRTILFPGGEDQTAGTTTQLPNGRYYFYAVGATGSGLTGHLLCGSASGGNVVNLLGGSQTVSLSLNAANCYGADFSPSTSYNHATSGFLPARFFSCDSTAADASMEALTGPSTCGSSLKGSLIAQRSFKVYLSSYSTALDAPAAGEMSEGLSSGCIRGSGMPSFANAFSSPGSYYNVVYTHGSSGVIYGGTSANVKYSTDGGATFASGSGASGNINAGGSFGSNAFLGSSLGVYRSTDAGATWSSVFSNGSGFTALAGNSAGTKIFAGDDGGFVAYSGNSGSSFVSVGTPTAGGVSLSQVNALYYDSSTGVLYAGGLDNSFTGSVLQTSDDGTTWSLTQTFAASGTVNVIKMASGRIYVGTNDGMRVSSDGGASWTTYMGSSGTYVYSVAINNGSVYVGTSGATIRWDDEGGASFGLTLTSSNGLSSSVPVGSVAMLNNVLFVAQGGGSSSALAWDKKGDGNPMPYVSTVVLPLGGISGRYPFAVRIQTYSDPACSQALSSREFPRGLSAITAASDGSVLRPDNTNNYSSVFLRGL